MAVTASTLRRLAELMLAPEQMAGVLGIIADMQAREDELETAESERKAKDRDRKRRGKSTERPALIQGLAMEPVPPKEIPLRTPLENTPSTSLRSDNQTAARATRIPEDFVPDVNAAYEAGLSDEETLREVANFLDYWRAKSANATKRDWAATWRIWCRRAAGDRPRQQGRGPPRSSPKSGWTELAFEQMDSAREPAPSNGFQASDDPVNRRGNGQASAPHRVLDAERSDPAGQPRSSPFGR